MLKSAPKLPQLLHESNFHLKNAINCILISTTCRNKMSPKEKKHVPKIGLKIGHRGVRAIERSEGFDLHFPPCFYQDLAFL